VADAEVVEDDDRLALANLPEGDVNPILGSGETNISTRLIRWHVDTPHRVRELNATLDEQPLS